MSLTTAKVNQHDTLRLDQGFFDESSKVVYAHRLKVLLRHPYFLEEPSHPSGIRFYELKVAHR